MKKAETKQLRKPKRKAYPGSGRPSAYRPDIHIDFIKGKLLEGCTLATVAEMIGVNVTTVNDWRNKDPKLALAISEARAKADGLVENALFQRAIGFKYDSEKIITVSDGNGAGSHVERVPIKEVVHPDVIAQRFWLMNRRPQEWRERQDVNVQGTIVTLGALVLQAVEQASAKKIENESPKTIEAEAQVIDDAPG